MSKYINLADNRCLSDRINWNFPFWCTCDVRSPNTPMGLGHDDWDNATTTLTNPVEELWGSWIAPTGLSDQIGGLSESNRPRLWLCAVSSIRFSLVMRFSVLGFLCSFTLINRPMSFFWLHPILHFIVNTKKLCYFHAWNQTCQSHTDQRHRPSLPQLVEMLTD